MSKLKGYLITEEIAEVKTIEKSLDSYYETLNCNLIDITTRKIGGKYFDIICDDEGLYKENPFVSAINENHEACLVGRLFIAQHDGQGNEMSLTDDEIKLIQKHIKYVVAESEIRPILVLDM